MLGLPKSTEMSKQLPKKAVYAKFQMNTAAKEKIDADISRITIVNEITPAKINIPAGEEVRSFFVLLVSLKKKDFDERTIVTLSKLIPQNILFELIVGGSKGDYLLGSAPDKHGKMLDVRLNISEIKADPSWSDEDVEQLNLMQSCVNDIIDQLNNMKGFERTQ